MTSARRTTVVLSLLALATVAYFGVSVWQGRSRSTGVSEPTIYTDDPSRGPAGAVATFIVYGDYQCSFCQEFSSAVDELRQAFPDKVREVWKDFPLPEHPQARPAALAGQCAAQQGKFWEFHDALFRGSGTLDGAAIVAAADAVGLDRATFTACQQSRAAATIVDRSIREGQALDITSVPTFFLDGQQYSEAFTYDELVALVEAVPVQSR